MPWMYRSTGWPGQPWGSLIVPLAVWSLIWTGLALWHAARRGEKWWFLFFLVVHTAGIVELIYLILVVKAFGQKKSVKHRS